MAECISKLTGKAGPLVNAHILPKALTSPDVRGRPMVQAGHRLIWSGWGKDEMMLVPGTNGIGFRKVEGIDTTQLRLFLLSILWRATMSKMHEFSAIRMLPSPSFEPFASFAGSRISFPAAKKPKEGSKSRSQ